MLIGTSLLFQLISSNAEDFKAVVIEPVQQPSKPLLSHTHSVVVQKTAFKTVGGEEKYYIISSNAFMNSKGLLDDLRNIPNNIKYVYKRNIAGFTFCTDNREIIRKIESKGGIINIEEVKLYKIGSVENDRNLAKTKNKIRRSENQNNILNPSDLVDKPLSSSKFGPGYSSRSVIPLYFYRMRNMGNLFFNNYVPDNFIFRIFGFNYLIKYFYSYQSYYSGKNVLIITIDSECNNQSKIITRVLTRPGAISSNASLVVLNDVDCNGTIWLSKLLFTLENVESTYIVFLPLSGPHSDILDQTINKIGTKTIVVAAAGNEVATRCNFSPNGHSVLKVGSVNKNDLISSFSNRGECNKLYALGKDVNGGNGTSYSAAMVASAAAIYLQKYPEAPVQNVLDYLLNNSMNNHNLYSILQLPVLNPETEDPRTFILYDRLEVFLFLIFIKFIVVVIIYIGEYIIESIVGVEPMINLFSSHLNNINLT